MGDVIRVEKCRRVKVLGRHKRSHERTARRRVWEGGREGGGGDISNICVGDVGMLESRDGVVVRCCLGVGGKSGVGSVAVLKGGSAVLL